MFQFPILKLGISRDLLEYLKLLPGHSESPLDFLISLNNLPPVQLEKEGVVIRAWKGIELIQDTETYSVHPKKSSAEECQRPILHTRDLKNPVEGLYAQQCPPSCGWRPGAYNNISYKSVTRTCTRKAHR